eukprot:GFYU01003551.1.p1 GENE.GFYU01003551.1~~GFYU01003551.1.p1  ORF type:complete len:287 (-),score=45.86 GFYU01003551.1:258-1055(-)
MRLQTLLIVVASLFVASCGLASALEAQTRGTSTHMLSHALRPDAVPHSNGPNELDQRVMACPEGVHFLGVDTDTKGNWLNPQRYGSMGGILFGARGTDVTLEGSARIEIINKRYMRIVPLGVDFGDQRALLLPGENPGNPRRGLGFVTNSTRDSMGFLNPLQMEIRIRGNYDEKYRVSVYICDWERIRDHMSVFGWGFGYDPPATPNVNLWPSAPQNPAEGMSAGSGIWLNYYVPAHKIFTLVVDNNDANFEPVISALMLDPYPS